jgi:hypothetical protein
MNKTCTAGAGQLYFTFTIIMYDIGRYLKVDSTTNFQVIVITVPDIITEALAAGGIELETV